MRHSFPIRAVAVLFLLAVLLTPISSSLGQPQEAKHMAASHRQFLNPAAIAPPRGYTHVVSVEAGRTIYISGQVGQNIKGEVSKDFAAQVTQAFENLKIALTAAGATPADIVKLNYYVVGLNTERLITLREVRNRYIDPKNPPASTLIGVVALAREEFLIEVEAVAVK